MGMNTDAVQRLYVAYFNRPADPASLSVYEAMRPPDREATQAELEAIAETYFSPSSEYQNLYSGMSNAQIINQLYQNLFGREAEAEGLLHWTGKLQDGSETFASIALQLTYSAQGTDLDSINGKITAAAAFTTEVASSTDNIIGFSGNASAASARSWLATVTDADTATAAVAGVSDAVSSAVAAGDTQVSGSSFTLSTSADNVTGTAGGDTITATLGTGATMTPADTITGDAGTDNLSITSTGTSNTSSAVTMNGVEKLTLVDTATTKTTIYALSFTGLETISVQGSTGGEQQFDNVANLVTLELISNIQDATDTVDLN